jgi:hypothetical protein
VFDGAYGVCCGVSIYVISFSCGDSEIYAWKSANDVILKQVAILHPLVVR